jgi:hypothetical protein
MSENNAVQGSNFLSKHLLSEIGPSIDNESKIIPFQHDR